MIHFDIAMRPSLQDDRAMCVYDYAFIKKDPYVCELILPMRYSLDCIGNIWGNLISDNKCFWLGTDSVRCFEGAALTPKITVCAENAETQTDECWHRVAFKKKDPTVCNSIINATLRSICKVRIDVLKKYPEFGETKYFNDDIDYDR